MQAVYNTLYHTEVYYKWTFSLNIAYPCSLVWFSCSHRALIFAPFLAFQPFVELTCLENSFDLPQCQETGQNVFMNRRYIDFSRTNCKQIVLQAFWIYQAVAYIYIIQTRNVRFGVRVGGTLFHRHHLPHIKYITSCIAIIYHKVPHQSVTQNYIERNNCNQNFQHCRKKFR